MSEYRLVMKGVVKTFPGVKALDHAQLELRPGKVMALMGENGAGKSTLMKCMFGIYKMDEGEIEYEGQKVTIPTPLDALDRGIAMVHQELQPIPARTVAENIWLGRYPTKKYGIVTVVDHAKMYKDTDALLKKLKLDIDPHAKLGSLSIAQMQMVEIAKAVSANCKVLILDEPTSSLTANEVESAVPHHAGSEGAGRCSGLYQPQDGRDQGDRGRSHHHARWPVHRQVGRCQHDQGRDHCKDGRP